jgi:hypothetical protein
MQCSLVDGCAARRSGGPFPARYFIGFMHALQLRHGRKTAAQSDVAFQHLLLCGVIIPISAGGSESYRFIDREGLTADNTSYLLVDALPSAHFHLFVT